MTRVFAESFDAGYNKLDQVKKGRMKQLCSKGTRVRDRKSEEKVAPIPTETLKYIVMWRITQMSLEIVQHLLLWRLEKCFIYFHLPIQAPHKKTHCAAGILIFGEFYMRHPPEENTFLHESPAFLSPHNCENLHCCFFCLSFFFPAKMESFAYFLSGDHFSQYGMGLWINKNRFRPNRNWRMKWGVRGARDRGEQVKKKEKKNGWRIFPLSLTIWNREFNREEKCEMARKGNHTSDEDFRINRTWEKKTALFTLLPRTTIFHSGSHWG